MVVFLFYFVKKGTTPEGVVPRVSFGYAGV